MDTVAATEPTKQQESLPSTQPAEQQKSLPPTETTPLPNSHLPDLFPSIDRQLKSMQKAARASQFRHFAQSRPVAAKATVPPPLTRFELGSPMTRRKQHFLSRTYFSVTSDVAFPMGTHMIRTTPEKTNEQQPPQPAAQCAQLEARFKANYECPTSLSRARIEAFAIDTSSLPSTPGIPNRLMKFHDRASGIKFLVDSGSVFSFKPNQPHDRRVQLAFDVVTATGNDVELYEPERMTLKHGDLRMPWKFLKASVKTPILGADFLSHHNLLIDLPNQRLIHAPTGTIIPCEPSDQMGLCYTVQHRNPARALLDEFPELLDEVRRPSKMADVQFEIKLQKGRVLKPPWLQHFNPQVEQMIEEHFRELERLGIVERATDKVKAEFSSPLAVVVKKDGTLRICGDYRGLNAITLNNSYGLPHLPSFNNKFAGSKYFSVIDLKRAFYQIPIKKSDRWKTAVRTPNGTFYFNYMSFGLKCASQQFQALIDSIFSDCRSFIYNYIDDIIVYSRSLSEHMRHLRTVFERLKEYGMKVNLDKSQLAQTSVVYLGYRIDETGVTLTDERVRALLNIKPPDTIRQLRSFLCAVGHFHKFLPGFHCRAKSLNQIRPKNPRRPNEPIQLNDEQLADFQAIKTMLANYTKLNHPVAGAPLVLESDASDRGAGAVLYQMVNRKLQPLFFYSKGFTIKQRSWQTYRKELEALYQAITRVESLLIGKSLTVFTDNVALLYNVRNPRVTNDSQALRKLSKISEHVDQIYFIATHQNVIADYLSRIPELELFAMHLDNYLGSRINYTALAAAQLKDPWISKLIESDVFKLRTKTFSGRTMRFWVHLDSAGRELICVPEELRYTVFKAYHDLHHPGWRRSYHMVATRFYWPLMHEICKYFTRCCERCQANRMLRMNVHPIRSLPVCSERMAHLNLDTVGPLPDAMVDKTNGLRFVLTVRDQYTRFLMLIPMRSLKMEEVFQEFANHWIGTFGPPRALTSDNHGSFCNHLMQYFCDRLGITQTTILPHMARGNGMIERPHSQLNTSIRCALSGKHWNSHLKFFQLFWNNSLLAGSKYTAHQLAFGYSARLPSDFLTAEKPIVPPKDIDEATVEMLRAMSALSPALTTHNNIESRPFIFKDMATCESVWLRDQSTLHKYVDRHRGPYKVIDRTDTCYTLEMDDGKHTKQSITLLKPSFVINPHFKVIPFDQQLRDRCTAETCAIYGHK